VPALLDDGYHAIGVDPAAPDGPDYRKVTFEEFDKPSGFDAVVASTSFHHVEDLDRVIERVADVLVPGGTVIVVEWAWERFDEATACWCFERLASLPVDDHPSWLQRHRDGWIESGKSWDNYFRDWVTEHGLHPAQAIVSALDARIKRRRLIEGPYFFSDLEHTTDGDEQSAIDSGLIRATGLRYVGVRQ
jgi:SAM-dependent methyltransferase